MTRRAVRANQKDLYYLSQLSERIEDVARSFLGAQVLHVVSKNISKLTPARIDRHAVAADMEQGAAARESPRILWPDDAAGSVSARLVKGETCADTGNPQDRKRSAKSTVTSCSTRARTGDRRRSRCAPFVGNPRTSWTNQRP